MNTRLPIIFITTCLLISVQAVSASEVQWGDTDSYILNWQNIDVRSGNLTIRLADFDVDNGLVYIQILENGAKVSDGVLFKTDGWYEGMYHNYDDRIRIRATDVTKKDDWNTIGSTLYPQAEIEIQTRGYPKLSVELEGGEFEPNTDAEIKVTVKNTGDADLHDVDLTVDIGYLNLKSGDTHRSFSNLPADSSRSIILTIRTGSPIKRTTYQMSASVTAYGPEDELYSASTTQSITVTESMSIIVRKTIVNEIGLHQQTNVNVQVHNKGLIRINNIMITDRLPNNFALVNNKTQLTWNVSLDPDEWASFSYDMKPLHPGKVAAPPAVAEWRYGLYTYVAQSSSPTIQVHGPFIIVWKNVDVTGEVLIGTPINVTLRVQNIGDYPVTTTIFDSVPEGFILQNGSIKYTEYLIPGNVYYFTYTIVPEIETTVTTSKPILTISDERFAECYTVYDPPSVMTVEPTVAPTFTFNPFEEKSKGEASKMKVESWFQSKIEPQLSPGFEAFFALIGLLIMASIVGRR